MGAYNVLKLESGSCPNCHHVQSWAIQFKYGDCWQYEYILFDKLRWGGNDLGDPTASIVLVEGITENNCNNCSMGDFYTRIFIDDNEIIAASLAVKNILFTDNPEGDYLIINK